MKSFDRVLRSVTEKMAGVAMVAIVACMVLVVSNVFNRGFGTGPIPGTYENVKLIAAVILSMGIAYLTFVRGHVAVGIIVDRLGPRAQAIFELFGSVISLVFGILITKGMFDYAMEKMTQGATTGELLTPLYPFNFLVTVALGLTCVVLIRDSVKAVIALKTGGEK